MAFSLSDVATVRFTDNKTGQVVVESILNIAEAQVYSHLDIKGENVSINKKEVDPK